MMKKALEWTPYVIMAATVILMAVGFPMIAANHRASVNACHNAGGEYVRKLDICVREDGTVIVGFDR